MRGDGMTGVRVREAGPGDAEQVAQVQAHTWRGAMEVNATGGKVVSLWCSFSTRDFPLES